MIRKGPSMKLRRDHTRRDFIKVTSACAAHMALMATPFPAAAQAWSRRSHGELVAQESFGRLESVGEGLWAFVSTPLGGDYTTVCNGGIIAGADGVLVVEAFQTPEGARWMAGRARELTGRWPSHILITHYHGDHSSGAEGFLPGAPNSGAEGVPPRTQRSGTEGSSPPDSGPNFHATSTTQALKTDGLPEDAPEALRRLWADVILVGEDSASAIDLGGRTVVLSPRRGHTPSDVTVELPEEGIAWCGDLVWNGMFPNYMDAIPSQLSRSVRALQGDQRNIYVPGHGPLAGPEDLSRYLRIIDGLEETARMARKEGWTADEAAARHSIPEEEGEWTLFNPSYFQRAVEAWLKEWG
jgi:glyoxylase-like metal-dependent hydrolase (beta-lactamase superfamily II)